MKRNIDTGIEVCGSKVKKKQRHTANKKPNMYLDIFNRCVEVAKPLALILLLDQGRSMKLNLDTGVEVCDNKVKKNKRHTKLVLLHFVTLFNPGGGWIGRPELGLQCIYTINEGSPEVDWTRCRFRSPFPEAFVLISAISFILKEI